MTYYRRNILEEVGSQIEDAEDRQRFKVVFDQYKFSSDRNDGVVYEGEFQRALVAVGLTNISNTMGARYTKVLRDKPELLDVE